MSDLFISRLHPQVKVIICLSSRAPKVGGDSCPLWNSPNRRRVIPPKLRCISFSKSHRVFVGDYIFVFYRKMRSCGSVFNQLGSLCSSVDSQANIVGIAIFNVPGLLIPTASSASRGAPFFWIGSFK